MPELRPFDEKAYTERVQNGACFICQMLAGETGRPEDIIYRDEVGFVFLSKYPSLYGYTLVAPVKHREQVTGDFTPEEYLALQQLVYRVGEAIRQAVPTERLYILSLGSQQGNRHVHWHVVPLPPGVPYHEQQLEALKIDKGYWYLNSEEAAALAQNIRQYL